MHQHKKKRKRKQAKKTENVHRTHKCLSRIAKPPLRLPHETKPAMMLARRRCLVCRIGVVFVVMVNMELADPNDCATPEPGVQQMCALRALGREGRPGQ